MDITEVSRYLAADGSQFSTRQAAEQYVAEVALIEAIMAPLAPRPDDFPHNGYLQHEMGAFTTAWNALLDLAATKFGPHEWFLQSRNLQADSSWAGRLIGELDHKAIWSEGWFRMSCTDRKTGREYNQPYFATHPNELEDAFCLNCAAHPAPTAPEVTEEAGA